MVLWWSIGVMVGSSVDDRTVWVMARTISPARPLGPALGRRRRVSLIYKWFWPTFRDAGVDSILWAGGRDGRAARCFDQGLARRDAGRLGVVLSGL